MVAFTGPASAVGGLIKCKVIVFEEEELQFNGFRDAVKVKVTVPNV
jgi:hypothetical protein